MPEGPNKKLQGFMLVLRLIAGVLLVILLTIHVKSLRAFRWERTVSGGVFTTYTVAVFGLALKTTLQFGEQTAFQVYICATGSVLLAMNAVVIYMRWKSSSQLTRMVAELLETAGVPLARQVRTKVSLGAVVAVLFLIDVFVSLLCYSAQ